MERAGTTRQVQPGSSRLDKEGRRVEAVGEERAHSHANTIQPLQASWCRCTSQLPILASEPNY